MQLAAVFDLLGELGHTKLISLKFQLSIPIIILWFLYVFKKLQNHFNCYLGSLERKKWVW